MNIFIEWISKIVLFLIIAMIADMVLPSGLMKKYARLVMSILLLLIFLGPLFQFLKVDPEQLMQTAKRTYDQQVNDQDLNESIEKKKNEILKAQGAYKLEQVNQALMSKLEKPLKDEKNVQLVELTFTFKDQSYQLESLDKLVLTLSQTEEKGQVEEINISVSDETISKTHENQGEVREWVADYLEMNTDQIEIRWEEEDE